MNYKTGLVSVSFRDKTPREILEKMKEAGLFYIEWGSDVHCVPESAKEIFNLQKEYGIECSSYGTYFRLGVTPIEKLKQYIDAAKILGTNILRLWCGDKNSQDYSESEKEALFAECKAAERIARENSVVLCMECHNKTYTNKKESALELMQTVGSPHFKMYWQPGQYTSVSENIAYATLLSPHTEHIHVFNWKEKEKYTLRSAKDIWQEYLACFEGKRTLLLEFMPDGRIETLKTEADALKEIINA